MSQNFEFYNTRAKEAAAEAKAAKLDNVRERALRSETAWREMADRAKQMEEDREVARIDREQRQAEAAELEAAKVLAAPEALAS
ncbi:hypothetical protein GCM10023115_09890 [Pontixanthobacter gangjinensis]|uniref:Uncharacterized protein n=1 Tax=Pontixanthobacter gangjinensis TaxID=1028742 RepID=A0A6I4SKK5_9SPHN|nr:hypothetical protein [Pontixanthobacter gangjinensis]MXO56235.1 hypothetical protein [Pontixanthobacter gangjinensis]